MGNYRLNTICCWATAYVSILPTFPQNGSERSDPTEGRITCHLYGRLCPNCDQFSMFLRRDLPATKQRRLKRAFDCSFDLDENVPRLPIKLVEPLKTPSIASQFSQKRCTTWRFYPPTQHSCCLRRHCMRKFCRSHLPDDFFVNRPKIKFITFAVEQIKLQFGC